MPPQSFQVVQGVDVVESVAMVRLRQDVRFRTLISQSHNENEILFDPVKAAETTLYYLLK